MSNATTISVVPKVRIDKALAVGRTITLTGAGFGGCTVALAPVLDGDIRPAWLSAPITVVPDIAQPGRNAAALYAVCLTAADDRCRP